MKNRSPIILFTFLRIETLKKTIEHLTLNHNVNEFDLFIFSDGPKNNHDKILILELREYLKKVSGFKSVTISESEVNKGLAKSVIEGVTEVLKNYDRAIILEDDLITSTNFLEFMDLSLTKYENDEEVLTISGYSFPKINDEDSDAYFLNRSWSWGWATWKSRWDKIDWSVSTYPEFSKNKKLKKQFSYLGSDVNIMLKRQMEGNLDSWLIRIVFHQFLVGGKTLYPTISKVINNGWDQYATHNKGNGLRFKTNFDISGNFEFKYPETLQLKSSISKRFLRRNSILFRVINILYDFLIKNFG